MFVLCWTWFTIRQLASAQLLRVAWELKEAVIYTAIIFFYSINKDTTKTWSYWRTSYFRQCPTCINSANVFIFSIAKRLYILRQCREQKQGWCIQISPQKTKSHGNNISVKKNKLCGVLKKKALVACSKNTLDQKATLPTTPLPLPFPCAPSRHSPWDPTT